MTAHEIHALSGAYAVDALDDLERARFEQHLAVCAECRAEVLSLQDATLLLSEVSSVAPPAAMRDKILADIKKVRPLPPSARPEPRRPRRWTGLVAAAAVLGVLGGSALVAQEMVSDNPRTQVQATPKIDAILQSSDVVHVSAAMPRGASATVFHSYAANGAVLVTRKMPDAPNNRVYQLWFKKNGRYISAGLMNDSGSQTILLKGTANDATAVGVTIEPQGGSNVPTTAPVALMDFEQAT